MPIIQKPQGNYSIDSTDYIFGELVGKTENDVIKNIPKEFQNKLLRRHNRLSFPLHYVSERGDFFLVKYLVNKGRDVNEKDSEGNTPLNLAFIGFAGDVAFTREAMQVITYFLLDKGADPNIASAKGWTPLHSAANLGLEYEVKLLLEHGANVNARAEGGVTPLMAAAASGSVEVARILIDCKADIDIRGDNGKTALQVAKDHLHSEMTKVLKALKDGVTH